MTVCCCLPFLGQLLVTSTKVEAREKVVAQMVVLLTKLILDCHFSPERTGGWAPLRPFFPLAPHPNSALPTAHTPLHSQSNTFTGPCLWRTAAPSSWRSRPLSSMQYTCLALAKMGSFCLHALPPQHLPWRRWLLVLGKKEREFEVYWKFLLLSWNDLPLWAYSPPSLYSATRTPMFPSVDRKTMWPEVARPGSIPGDYS